MFRVTGTVTRVESRSGEKANESTGEIRPWSMTFVKVMIAGQAVVEVVRFDDSSVPMPHRGQEVDWAVEVGVNKGRLSVSLDDEWDAVTL